MRRISPTLTRRVVGKHGDCRTGLSRAGDDSRTVMLSGALQRNATHEARLSNISVYCPQTGTGINPRFFASLRMTSIR